MDAAQDNNPPVVQPEIDDNNDADSLLQSEIASSTVSVNSSILEYRRENGRTYHAYKEGAYYYPNDDAERDRLDLQHHMWGLTLDGKLGLAPPNSQPENWTGRVLDLGTGTGIWSLDFGDEHPNSQVIGVDLSPIQPQFTAPNVFFQVDDIDETWTYSDKFDYIHSRMMTSSIADWKALLQKCYDNLKPGGWVELQEISPPTSDDGTMRPGSALYQAAQILHEGSAKVGKPFIDVWDMKPMLEGAGFVNATQERFHWPNNTWPKQKHLKTLGIWTNMNLKYGLEAFCMAFGTRVLGWSADEIRVLAAKGIAEGSDRTIHSYWPIGVAYAQKPE